MTYLTRMSAFAAVLLVSALAAAQTDEPTDTEAAESTESDAAEAADDATDDEADEEPAVQAPAPADVFRYRFLGWYDYDRLVRVTGLDAGPVLDCGEEAEAGRRERMVTLEFPMTVFVLDDLALHVSFDGDDPDGEIQSCIDEAVGGQELEPAPSDLARSRYRWTFYNDTYYARRRMRHGEIISLYTLSGASAAVGIGAFVAARNDDAEREARRAESGEIGGQQTADRADRFRRAGWSMVGVSIGSFVGATLLYTRNRDIESRENPVLVISPGSPTGDLGFTLSSRF